jgi:hypothetical protein
MAAALLSFGAFSLPDGGLDPDDHFKKIQLFQ